MANTYALIASVVVGPSGSATIDFQNIPPNYKDLQLLTSLRCTRASVDTESYIKFNNNTSNYSYKSLYSNPNLGTTVSSGTGNTYPMILTNAASSTVSTFSNCSIYIPNYAGSNNKSLTADSIDENNGLDAYTYQVAGLWSNTAAINQITLTPFSGSYVQYSNVYLYGITNT